MNEEQVRALQAIAGVVQAFCDGFQEAIAEAIAMHAAVHPEPKADAPEIPTLTEVV